MPPPALTVPGPIMKGMAIDPAMCSGCPRMSRIASTPQGENPKDRAADDGASRERPQEYLRPEVGDQVDQLNAKQGGGQGEKERA